MAKHLKLLGMDRADERTMALAAALATHAHGLETTVLLTDVRALKDFCKVTQSLLSGPVDYPESHADLKRAQPDIYAQAFGHIEPTLSKWTREFRALIVDRAPCRSTRRGVNQFMLSQPKGGLSSAVASRVPSPQRCAACATRSR